MLGSPAVPLYLDRHDLPGVTAEDVARAHAEDLKVSGKHDVSFLSYWFDPDLGTAFCLARAPAAANVAEAHAEAHGQDREEQHTRPDQENLVECVYVECHRVGTSAVGDGA